MNPLPKQPNNTIKFYNFSSAVQWHMKNKGMTQADLVEKTCLSKTTISRICRNSNDKGAPQYTPTLHIVMAVSIGLKLNRTEAEQLLFTAFPEMELWGRFLDERLTIMDANEILDSLGYTLLGNMKEE